MLCVKSPDQRIASRSFLLLQRKTAVFSRSWSSAFVTLGSGRWRKPYRKSVGVWCRRGLQILSAVWPIWRGWRGYWYFVYNLWICLSYLLKKNTSCLKYYCLFKHSPSIRAALGFAPHQKSLILNKRCDNQSKKHGTSINSCYGRCSTGLILGQVF